MAYTPGRTDASGDGAGLQREPIAIIGMGCRLPGHASSPSKLWDLLIQNKSGHCDVPPGRYNAEGFYHPDAERPGSINSTGGYFIQEDIHAFENAFFGINNLEASYMDAQQRKLLEVVYESFESAGVPLNRVQGSKTGVYIGNFTNDYMIMQYRDPEFFSRYSATGSGPTVLANRITHCFDLRGSSVVLDTACSSSLYALHSACLALDAYDCDAAVVASANLIQTPEQQLIAVKAGILSPDSTCHTFDESANGYGRAEGASSLYLKRLSDALRDGDPIRSVIRGTAVNGNGKTPGIVQPSVDGQMAVIWAAYQRASLSMNATDYVEAHGTGTKVGDPIEIEGISRVFRYKTKRPTLVGGIKPNLGHSEGASGISSVIKLVLALERGVIPATIGIKKINPSIKTSEWNVKIVTANRRWPASRVPRASVNSFGFGGANSHAILEAHTSRRNGYTEHNYGSDVRLNGHTSLSNGHVPQISLSNGHVPQMNGYSDSRCSAISDEDTHVNGDATQINGRVLHLNGDGPRLENDTPIVNRAGKTAHDHRTRVELLTFSAQTEHSLTRVVEGTASYVSQAKEPVDLRNLAYTLNRRRSRLANRAFLLASPSSLQNDLSAERLTKKDSGFSATLPLTFVYTGQGAQWAGMGKELFEQYLVFRNSIERLDTCLQRLEGDLAPPWSIEAMLLTTADSSDINRADKSQPICTAVQIALTDVLRDWGIVPQTVIGHSSGEIAAAYAACYLTAPQAILAAFCRGKAVSEGARKGAMMAVGLEKNKAHDLITELGLLPSISIACINSPESITLSGDDEAIDKMCGILQERKIFARKLKTDGRAYHSHHMRAVGSRYLDMLERVWQPRKGYKIRVAEALATGYKLPSVRMISTVTGLEAIPDVVASPEYWRLNLESPVRFEVAVKTVLEHSKCHFLEIGPHSALELPIKQTARAVDKDRDSYLYNSAIIRGKDPATTILDLVGSLFLHGHDQIMYEQMLLDELEPGNKEPQMLLDLPPYPWDYTAPTLWNESRAVTEFRNRKYPRHDLLGSQLHGGSKCTTTWRNILDINEVIWLRDHCLGPSIVLPAAAYIAMATEAICQVAGLRLHECPGVELRKFNFLKALDFHPEQRSKVEVITEMRRSQVSGVTTSNTWWQFSVSSIASNDSEPTIHVNGLVSLSEKPSVMSRQIQLSKDTMEQQATRVWYDKFTKEGLNWGPQFAVMEEIFCDRARKAHEAVATTHLLRGDDSGLRGQPQYIAHPISIDSMLQTAFVATTGGWVRELRATVPVTIDSVHISAPALLDMDTIKQWSIDTISERVGFGTVKIDAELHNSSNQVLVRMSNVRCIAYQGNVQAEPTEQRNPLVRVAWKPDITALAPGLNNNLSKYIDWFAENCRDYDINAPDRSMGVAAALDLVVHKRPNARILELGAQPETTSLLMRILRAEPPLRRFDSYLKGFIDENGELQGSEITSTQDTDTNVDSHHVGLTKDKFDIVLLCEPNETPITRINDWVAPSAIIIATTPEEDVAFSELNCEKIIETGLGLQSVTLAIITEEPSAKPSSAKPQVILVNRNGVASQLDIKLQQALECYFRTSIPILRLSEVNTTIIPARSLIISTIEAEQPLLNTISNEDMTPLKAITENASKVFWITSANIMGGVRPDFTPVLGLSRALMLEQPSVQFSVFDVDDPTAGFDVTARNVTHVMHQLIHAASPDLELAQKDGVVHVLRWEPEEPLNAEFRLKQNGETINVAVEDVGRCELGIKEPGQLDTIHFVTKNYENSLPADHVEIQVKSVGMNAKDLYVLGAKVDTKDASCSCECAGVVADVGTEVTDLKPGDRVVAMAPGHFATSERLPRWAVCKLHDDEEFTTASTIPIVFSTALYALKHRADLQPGESILVHSAAGGVGIAAIQLAKHMGAEIFATVGNESKKAFLADEFGLDPAKIFSSRDSSFLPAIMAATSGQGVDVVLNSLTGELLRNSFEACADFGRFVEIGKRDILDHGSLDMATFGRNVSFTAFDLSSLYLSKKQSHHQLWQKLLAESMDLIRSGIARPCFPLEVFDASEITQAFRHFSRGTRMGKVAVSFEDGRSRLEVIPNKHETVLSREKSYLMVGCLGGLGRSLSKWMMSRGARNFVFLGRSGLEKPVAKDLVDDLREQGAEITVVRGDVGRYEDVEQAVQACTLPIGGVVQAAMGLSEALWSAMTHESWHTSIRPKAQGTWNLHHALRDGDRDAQLDFFVMTSSISGSVGTATESNYCAGNAFLDAFARHRNALGLPAVSVGLGMIAEVGYLHEHPDIEALMKRKGIHAITEDELLQIMDLALTHQHPSTWRPHYDRLVGSHLLTGIEFIGLKEQRDRGFEGDNHVLADPRASLFAAAFARSTSATTDGAAAATAAHGLPAEVAHALRQQRHANGDDGGASVLNAVRAVVASKMANLILLPADQLRPEQSLGDFGLDSMLAAEFRTFIFHALEVDVPFMTLLDKGTSVDSLARLITAGLEERGLG